MHAFFEHHQAILYTFLVIMGFLAGFVDAVAVGVAHGLVCAGGGDFAGLAHT